MDYMDASLSPEYRAKDLLADLTLDEKMAQVSCVFPFDQDCFDFEKISDNVRFGISSVSTLEMRRMKTTEAVCAWQRQVQEIVMANSPHHIPAAFHMEGLCGAFIQDATSFQSGVGRGASFNPALEEKIASIISRQEAACGITQILAPVLDVIFDPRMGRSGEPYGEDPTLCAVMGAAYTRGAQETTTAGRRPDSIAKHFLSFHTSAGGIHGAHSLASSRSLQEVYGKPFQAAIKLSNLKGIMPCYNVIDGEPASASPKILQGLLRDEMGFTGLCFSDYGAVGNVHSVLHVGESYGEAGLRCLTAGMDIEAPSPCGFSDELKAMFERGEADISLLDKAVERVLTAKFRMGLFEHPFALTGQELLNAFTGDDDQSVTLQSAEESLVLIKNDGVLPLQKHLKHIAVIGPHADHPRKMFGGYTHMCMAESTLAAVNSIAGVNGNMDLCEGTIKMIPGTCVQSDETPELDAILALQKPACLSLLTSLREHLPQAEVSYAYGYPVAGADTSGFSQALQMAAGADVIILTLGGKHGTCSLSTMGEGVDASSINLPPCQDAFLREVSKLGKPLVGVHFDGRSISSDAADECLHAILEAWSPAEMGGIAVASALVGDVNPSGKMPVTTARHAGQLPMVYNHPNNSAWHQGGSIGFADYVDLPHTPRFCFGHGLSYTTFAYSDLKVDPPLIGAKESTHISFTLQNTGHVTGCEVVQLYLRDEYASLVRPVKELAGFVRVTLSPGDSSRVTFIVRASQMAFLDENMRWKVERGHCLVEIGSSSEDIRLTGHYSINEVDYLEGKERAIFAETTVE